MSTYDDEPTFDEDETPAEEESSNRTFLVSAGVLGGLVLLGLLCAAGYLFFQRGSGQQTEATAYAQATNQQATIQVGLTQNAQVQGLTLTAAVTNTVPPTNTPVIAQATSTTAGGPTQDPVVAATVAAGFTQLANSTQDPAAAATIGAGLTQIANATQNPATATIAAGFTQLAMSTQTVIATSTALPNTGFADDIGAPGLLLMAIALVVVIFLVRRLRAVPTK